MALPSFSLKTKKRLKITLPDFEDQEQQDIIKNNQDAKKCALSSIEKHSKSQTLKDQGSSLAEKGHFSEAMKKWNQAISITPDDEMIYEMKAQVFMLLDKDFFAAQSAEVAVEKNRIWWPGWLTLGRAQMNLQDFEMAKKSLSRAFHLNPSETDIHSDLMLALKMKRKCTDDDK